ncbi:unnamed protein product, partial [Didymodactylos carnosus]
MGHMHGQWSCCGPHLAAVAATDAAPWNFKMDINYDAYVWDCSPSTNYPDQLYTNVSCLLTGSWSLDRITFQLTAIPANLPALMATYTMKNQKPETVMFSAEGNWAATVPVNRNSNPGSYNINDKLEFSYGGRNYT